MRAICANRRLIRRHQTISLTNQRPRSSHCRPNRGSSHSFSPIYRSKQAIRAAAPDLAALLLGLACVAPGSFRPSDGGVRRETLPFFLGVQCLGLCPSHTGFSPPPARGPPAEARVRFKPHEAAE